jgi:hypothetical protein
VKFKSTNVDKLIGMHQNDEEEQQQENQHLLTLDERKKKFEEYKHLLDKQVGNLFILFFLIKKIFVLFLSSSKLI